jgi:hypothetical protein
MKKHIQDDGIVIAIPELNDATIKMEIRGWCDCDALFLGQHVEPDGDEHDLYYLPHEDTFLWTDIYADRPEGEKYNVGAGEYRSLGGIDDGIAAKFYRDREGHALGEAYRRWTLLNPLHEAQTPTPGMIFTYQPAARTESVERRYVNLEDDEGRLNPALLQQDGTLIWGGDDPISFLLDVDRFLYLQKVGLIKIEDEEMDIPKGLGIDGGWSDWWNSLNWAPGHTPADLDRKFCEHFQLDPDT